MEKVKIGLLPMYIKLYDDYAKECRRGIEEFYEKIKAALENAGASVFATDICRVREEFDTAVKSIEQSGASALVTLNLAYSPSLESIDALLSTDLPILVLDTTRDFVFNFDTPGDFLMYNHGIHGVQDICNLLKRGGRTYSVFAGHFEQSDVIKRLVDAARAIKAASSLRGMRVGKIGKAFDGMGDFAVSCECVKRLGIEVLECEGLDASVTKEALEGEYKLDLEKCTSCVSFEEYAFAGRVALSVRKWLDENDISAFTMNFLEAGKIRGFDTMPFSEASKAMARGIGYAGEGDFINATLVGALMRGFEKVNFLEMFCPDWKNNTVYCSHMGECNLALMEDKRMLVKPFPYVDCPDPVSILGNIVEGSGCIFNMAPNAEGWFDAVIVEGEMIKVPDGLENFKASINGWFKPKRSLEKLLEKYSELGGTHHSAFVYGVSSDSLKEFAKALGMKYSVL